MPRVRGRADADPDALYAKRDEIASARRAVTVWQSRLQPRRRGISNRAWKLARARYWLGGHAAASEARPSSKTGSRRRRPRPRSEPDQPEGHFWMAANMGALAESFGMRQGIKYRGAIKDALLTVLNLDPAFQQGSADRALGRWYSRCRGCSAAAGRSQRSTCARSLTYASHSISSQFFLAETLFELDREAEARAELQRVLDAPIEPEWAPEDREFKAKATQRLRGQQIPSSKHQAPRNSQLPTPKRTLKRVLSLGCFEDLDDGSCVGAWDLEPWDLSSD